MEEKFLAALAANREKAAKLGVRIRPVTDMAQAKRNLSGSRTSDGFSDLAQKGGVWGQAPDSQGGAQFQSVGTGGDGGPGGGERINTDFQHEAYLQKSGFPAASTGAGTAARGSRRLSNRRSRRSPELRRGLFSLIEVIS